MKKRAVIDFMRTTCDLLQNCLRDDVFPEDTKVNIEVNRTGAEISVVREYSLPQGRTGKYKTMRKYDLHTYKMFSDEWEDATAGMNGIIKARGEFYDPDEKGKEGR